MGKVDVTNHRLLQNKALGSIKICEELQGSLAGVPQPSPGCWMELCWLGKGTFMACLSLCEQYFANPVANPCLLGQHFGCSGGGISKRHWLGAIFLISELLQRGNAVIQGLCSVTALGGGWKTAPEAQGNGNCWYLIQGSERELLCSKCSSGRRWWGSARLCSIRGTALPRGFQLPSTGNIRGISLLEWQ